jgi:hypothetical protein
MGNGRDDEETGETDERPGPRSDGLTESEAEEAFFGRGEREAANTPLKIPVAAHPKVKPRRVDPTPSEEFFGESLSKMVEEIDKEDSCEE